MIMQYSSSLEGGSFSVVIIIVDVMGILREENHLVVRGVLEGGMYADGDGSN